MPFGAQVRSALGPLEGRAIKIYRDWFVDLAELARDIAALGPFERVLEIGAGDGILSRSLADALPGTAILGIDIAPDPGRMVPDRDDRVTFRQISTSELIVEGVEPLDLVVVADVLHHVPPSEHEHLVSDATSLLASGGLLVVEDWERTRSASHLVGDVADRYISGDRQVSYMTRGELGDLMLHTAPSLQLAAEFRIPPRHNNLLMAFRSSTPTPSPKSPDVATDL